MQHLYHDKCYLLLTSVILTAELNTLIAKLDERYEQDLEQRSHYHPPAKERRIAEPVEYGPPAGAPQWAVKDSTIQNNMKQLKLQPFCYFYKISTYYYYYYYMCTTLSFIFHCLEQLHRLDFHIKVLNMSVAFNDIHYNYTIIHS